jgi:hypothetical protein
MDSNNQIIIYQTEDGQTQVDVRLENETVWLTQAQMAELFEKTPQNITMHIGNAYKEGELEKEPTCKEYLQVQQEGKRKVSRMVKYYDLDVIISVSLSPDGTKRIADSTLVALTLMIAESRTEEKDVMVKVVVNLINKNNDE